VSYPSGADPGLQADLASSDPLDQHLAQYQATMIAAYDSLFINADPLHPLSPPAPDSGTAVPLAKKLACAFVSQHLYAGAGGTPPNPLLPADVCGADYGNACGAVPTTPPNVPRYPDSTCKDQLIQNFYNTVNAANTTASNTLNAFTQDPSFMARVKNYGWAGMGIWYREIAKVNTTVSKMTRWPVSISQGTADAGLPPGFASAALDPDGHIQKTNEVLTKYKDWWQQQSVAPTIGGVPAPTPTGPAGANSKASIGDSDADAIKSAISAGDREGAANAMVSKIVPDYDPVSRIEAWTLSQLYPVALLSLLGDFMILTGTLIYAALILIPAAVSLFGTIPLVGGGAAAEGVVISTSPLWAMFGVLAGTLLSAGVMLAFWLPILPLIRVVFGVVTWMIAIFEAVVMVPIAALAHLTTEGEGIAGGAKGVWVIWLNILLRPALMVIGYVGAIIAFNTFVTYFNQVYWGHWMESVGTLQAFLGCIVYTVLGVGIYYMVANSLFKMIDLVPSAVSKYLGGHADHSFDQDASGFVSGFGGMAKGMGEAGAGRSQRNREQKGTPALDETRR
jgi:conjugal transfer/type IV secretion protein DotA/TraY